MRNDVLTHAHGSRRWVAVLAALACALPLVALTATPAFAAKPGKAGAVWVTQQIPRTGPTVAVRLQWVRVRGATSYEIDYAAASGTITQSEVRDSRTKRTAKARGRRGMVQTRVIRGLQPGKIYCFQVRGRNGAGFGLRGGIHCKLTVRTSRAKPVSSFPLVVGTFNTCSNACASSLGGWGTRGRRVRDRILQMNVGRAGRPADVVAIQEGNQATSYLREELDGTFTQACQTGDGTGNHWDDNQSMFVRDATYKVVPGTAGGIQFTQFNDPSHGACWAMLREKESQQEVVVVGLHLWHVYGAASDTRRAQQTDVVINAVTAQFPGATIVYAGDFNSTRSRATDGPLKRLRRHGQDDAYDQALRYLSRPYRNSATGTSTTARVSWKWGDHIDRVFVPPGVHVASWKVDYRMNGRRHVSPMASDHNPVLVSLLIPATP